MANRGIFKDEDGGPAAEFALVLPIALLFLFGIIDVGRFMWEVNQAEKATQMGARFAAVTDIVPSTLATTNFVSSTVAQGDPIPASSFAGTRCINGSCSYQPTTSCPTSGATTITNWGYSSNAFSNIVSRIGLFKPDVTAANVVVDYANVGLGYAGDPFGSDVSALVTVRLCGLSFQPLTTLLFSTSIAMPDFSYSLTMEDGVGTTTPN